MTNRAVPAPRHAALLAALLSLAPLGSAWAAAATTPPPGPAPQTTPAAPPAANANAPAEGTETAAETPAAPLRSISASDGLLSTQGSAAPASNPRARMATLAQQLQSPFVDERLDAIRELGKTADKGLAADFKIPGRLLAIANDVREFEKIRSAALRSLAGLYAVGIADGNLFETILAIAGSPDTSERVAIDALGLLVELAVGNSELYGPQVQNIQNGLRKIWSAKWADYVKAQKAADDGLPAAPVATARTFGRILAAYAAISHNDALITTDFLINALTRGQGSEKDIFQRLADRNQDTEIIVGALAAIRLDMENALYTTAQSAASDQTRVRDIANGMASILTRRFPDWLRAVGREENSLRPEERAPMLAAYIADMVRTPPPGQADGILHWPPEHLEMRLAMHQLLEMMAVKENAALSAKALRADSQNLLRKQPALVNVVYPLLLSTPSDREADAILRFVMYQLDPQVADLLIQAASPRPQGMPQLHIDTMARINSALIDLVRQQTELMRPRGSAATSMPPAENSQAVTKSGWHFLTMLYDRRTPAAIRRMAAINLGLWPPELKSYRWPAALRELPGQRQQFLNQWPPYVAPASVPGRPPQYQDMEYLAVAALVDAVINDPDPTVKDAALDSLQYLTGERFILFDDEKLAEAGPDPEGWREWWSQPRNWRRFQPATPAPIDAINAPVNR